MTFFAVAAEPVNAILSTAAAGQVVAGLAHAGDQLEHRLLGHNLGKRTDQPGADRGREFAGLEDDPVPGRKSVGDRPHRREDRVVPRPDHADNAERLVLQRGRLVDRHQAAAHPARAAGRGGRCLAAQSMCTIVSRISSWASASGLPVSVCTSSASRPMYRVRYDFQASSRCLRPSSRAPPTTARPACARSTVASTSRRAEHRVGADDLVRRRDSACRTSPLTGPGRSSRAWLSCRVHRRSALFCCDCTRERLAPPGRPEPVHHRLPATVTSGTVATIRRADSGRVVAQPGGPGEQHGADRLWLREAIRLSRQCPPSATAFSVGAVLVGADGNVLSTGYSRERDRSDHAEEVALDRLGLPAPGGAAAPGPGAASGRGAGLAGATLYSSLEPCAARASRPVPCADLDHCQRRAPGGHRVAGAAALRAWRRCGTAARGGRDS